MVVRLVQHRGGGDELKLPKLIPMLRKQHQKVEVVAVQHMLIVVVVVKVGG